MKHVYDLFMNDFHNNESFSFKIFKCYVLNCKQNMRSIVFLQYNVGSSKFRYNYNISFSNMKNRPTLIFQERVIACCRFCFVLQAFLLAQLERTNLITSFIHNSYATIIKRTAKFGHLIIMVFSMQRITRLRGYRWDSGI